MHSNKNRSLAIDCLRGIAVLLVVYYHYTGSSGAGNPLRHGLYGVMLFFVISGYCIALSADSAAGAWHFYAKRLGRLLPALFVCALLTTVMKMCVPLIPERLLGWDDFFYTFIALPTLNVAGVDYRWPDSAYWSLAVEFSFYALILVLFVAGLRHRLLSAVALVCVGLSATVLLNELQWPVLTPYLPYFLAGMAFKRIYEDQRRAEGLCFLALAALMALAGWMGGISDASIPASAQSLIAFAACIGLFWLMHVFTRGITTTDERAPTLFLVRALSAVGLVSYPLYLLHQDIGKWAFVAARQFFGVTPWSATDWILRALLLPMIVLLLATAVYLWVERPWIKPLTAWFVRAPSAWALKVNQRLRGLDAAPPTPRTARFILLSSVSAVILIGIGAGRFYQSAHVATALSTVRQLTLRPEQQGQSPWGNVVTQAQADVLTIDLYNVPATACAELLNAVAQWPEARRLAASTRASEEMALPISAWDSERACFGLKRRIVRLVLARQE